MERKLSKENWLGSCWPAFPMLSLSMAKKMIKSTFSSVQLNTREHRSKQKLGETSRQKRRSKTRSSEGDEERDELRESG